MKVLTGNGMTIERVLTGNGMTIEKVPTGNGIRTLPGYVVFSPEFGLF